MSGFSEMDTFHSLWASEAEKTSRVLKALHPISTIFVLIPRVARLASLHGTSLYGPNREEMRELRARLQPANT